MNKLTAEKCAWLIRQLKSAEVMSGELSIADQYKLQALEIALPVLEQQENKHQWDAEGERCVKCGDKDWFSGDRCDGKLPTQPSTNPQIDNDGWIEWGGNREPVAYGAIVEVLWTDGGVETGPCRHFYWARNCGNPIIAYRVIQEQPTNQNGEQ